MNEIKNSRIKRAGIAKQAIHLASFSLLEPESESKAFEPSWYNVWEAFLYQKAMRKQHIAKWYFKRFGVDESITHGEAVRKTHYREWLNILEKSGKLALDKLHQQEAFTLKTARNALLYVDSWGEITALEETGSWRDAFSIDILPKSLVKLYGARDYTCKIRGERSSLLNAFILAEQLLNSDTVDNVIVCGQFRAFPVLVLSEIDKPQHRAAFFSPSSAFRLRSLSSNLLDKFKQYAQTSVRIFGLSSEYPVTERNSPVSVERVGCFIFKKHSHSVNHRTAHNNLSSTVNSNKTDHILMANEEHSALDDRRAVNVQPRLPSSSARTITYPYRGLAYHSERQINAELSHELNSDHKHAGFRNMPAWLWIKGISRAPKDSLIEVIQQTIQPNTQSILFSSPPIRKKQAEIQRIINVLQGEPTQSKIATEFAESADDYTNEIECNQQIFIANINHYYGDSGCLNPALCWEFLACKQLTQGHHIFVHLDAYSSIWFTETWY